MGKSDAARRTRDLQQLFNWSGVDRENLPAFLSLVASEVVERHPNKRTAVQIAIDYYGIRNDSLNSIELANRERMSVSRVRYKRAAGIRAILVHARLKLKAERALR